jgi:hypothetical protein
MILMDELAEPMNEPKRLLHCLLGMAMAVIASAAPLPFLQNNFAKALAEAQQRKLPIFVECWAPW